MLLHNLKFYLPFALHLLATPNPKGTFRASRTTHTSISWPSTEIFKRLIEEKSIASKGDLTNKQILLDYPVRIREKSGQILTKVYKNGPMKPQGMIDRKKLVIEFFSFPLEKDQILIYFTVIDSKTLLLKPIKELIINKNHSLNMIGMSAMEAGIDIPIDLLTATKIRDLRSFFVEDVIGHRFFEMNAPDKIVSLAPFYLDVDGCLFMLSN